MGIYYFPCNFVHWKNIENHDIIKKSLIPQIDNIKNKYINNRPGLHNAYTSYNEECDDSMREMYNILTKDNFIMQKIVWEPLDELLDLLNSREGYETIKIKSSYVSSCWFSIYDNGGQFSYHTHLNSFALQKDGKIFQSSFSMIYILHDENETNSTEFMEPSMSYVSTQHDLESRLHTNEIKDIKEGTLLIFPSSLYHSVTPCKIPGRITIAINIASNF